MSATVFQRNQLPESCCDLLLILSLLGCLGLAACSSPQPQPPTTEPVSDSAPTEEAPAATVEAPTTAPTPEEPFPGDGPWSVTFVTEDGLTLHGTVFGKGAAGIVLAPMYIGGPDAWFPFAQMLSENGYRVLTFDYRGYGESEGSRDVTQAAVDVTAAVDFLKANDVSPMVIIGAGIGGSAGIKASSQDLDSRRHCCHFCATILSGIGGWRRGTFRSHHPQPVDWFP